MKPNAPRIAAKQHGIVHVTGKPDIACTLRNLSDLGAQLNFPNPTILPRVFQLKFDGTEQRVTVMWQSGRLSRRKVPDADPGRRRAEEADWPWSRK